MPHSDPTDAPQLEDDSQAGEVIELPNVPPPADDDAGDDAGDDYDPPLGEPFALAIGCDLLPIAPGVPGCWASVRCDCGRAFKVDLLSAGLKPCPGCATPYAHVLLVAPSDDRDIVPAFLDAIEGAPEDDDAEPDAHATE